MKLSRTIAGILLVCFLVFGVMGFAFSQQVPKARFSFFHAAPDTPAVDIVVEDNVLFSNITFNTKTEFELIDADDYTISVNVAGTSDVILGPVKATMKQGRDHILFITGLVEEEPELDAKMLVKKTRPAFFRFYNTSPDLGDVSIFINENLYFQNIAYGAPTKFEKISFGTAELVIKQEDNTVLGPVTVDFEAGKAYTIVLVGKSTATGGAALKVEVIEE